ncbi:MAG: ribonuclease P protein component [Caulobacteraceae bacterium]|nr:ribonuclease P protein component [Caulobacter sp.]
MTEVPGDAPHADDVAAPPPALERLKTRPQFLHVAQGLSAARGAVMVQVRPRDDAGGIRVGFTATRKVGGAVVRNRAKRRLREAAREVLPARGRAAHDYVLVARQGTPDRPWAQLLDDLRAALAALERGGDPPRPRRPRK